MQHGSRSAVQYSTKVNVGYKPENGMLIPVKLPLNGMY